MNRFTLLIILFFLYSCGNNDRKNTADNEGSVVQQPLDSLNNNDSTARVKNEKLTYLQSYDRALSLWKIPFEEIDIETSCGKAHVIISGPATAEPLVLLHGMNASSTMWYPNIRSLSEKYRVYAIDFFMEPGKSLCQKRIEHTSEIINWYYEVFDQLHLKKFSLLGASRGGWLAINIALHSKFRINKIALLSPAQTFIWIKLQPKILFNIAYSISPKRKRLRSVLETMTFDIDKINQIYINQYFLATKKASFNKCFLQMKPFSDRQLQSLKMPILLLIGDQDIVNNDKSLEKAQRLLSNLKTQKVKNAGHFLSIDQPEIIDKELLDFFK